jgi:hypothetical protein
MVWLSSMISSSNLIPRYPDFFSIHDVKGLDYLCLENWDSSLAVTIREKKSFEGFQICSRGIPKDGSLTMERRLTSDKLDIFHKEYRLPCKLLLCLVKNHGIFYITNKGSKKVLCMFHCCCDDWLGWTISTYF